jgi:hypothetical protein
MLLGMLVGDVTYWLYNACTVCGFVELNTQFRNVTADGDPASANTGHRNLTFSYSVPPAGVSTYREYAEYAPAEFGWTVPYSDLEIRFSRAPTVSSTSQGT